MAHLSGLIDAPDAHPTLRVMPSGTVLLNMDNLGLRFPTMAKLASWLEDIDRQLVQLEQPPADTYHEKFQALRAVKGSA